MMKYEEFKEAFLTDFKKYLPEEYRDRALSIEPVIKINTVMDGVSLDLIVDGIHICPTIYLNQMYEKYLKTENLQKVFENAAMCIAQAVNEISEKSERLDFKNAKENIVFQVVNTLQNKTLLEDIPHREFLDLSIIYRWVIEVDEKGIQSFVIHNSLAERLGMNEEQLFKCAVENTRRIFPPTVKSINDVIREIRDGMPAEIADMMIDEFPEDKMVWVISNNRGINGAGSILYEDNLHKLASQLESDLYILPSSVHECIATSASIVEPYCLTAMVREINLTELAIEDRLSNLVYHYSRTTRKLTVAVDNPNRSLDDMGTGTSLM